MVAARQCPECGRYRTHEPGCKGIDAAGVHLACGYRYEHHDWVEGKRVCPDEDGFRGGLVRAPWEASRQERAAQDPIEPDREDLLWDPPDD